MADSKHSAVSYYFEKRLNKLVIPVQLYSYPFNSMLTVSANALWDTGATMSAITPEIRDKLKAETIQRKKITAVHTAKEVDVVLITIELPNRGYQANYQSSRLQYGFQFRNVNRYGHYFVRRFCLEQR